MKWLLCSFLVLMVAVPRSHAQELPISDLGTPIIRNYTQMETGGHSQNWDIVQDNNGILYFANTDGILEYDGVNWRRIATPTGLVFSLAIDESNRIYAGSEDDLGFLAPDSLGLLRFYSLRHEIDSTGVNFRGVRRTFATPDGIYFVAAQHIFRWNRKEMKSWGSGGSPFHISAMVNGSLLVRQPGIGMMELKNEQLQLITGGEKFADLRVYFILPTRTDPKKWLIGSADQGLFLYDNGDIRAYPTEVDAFLKENWVYDAVRLPDMNLAISTIFGGAVVLNEDGRMLYTLQRETGLQNQSVKTAFIDEQGALWLALDNGISRVATHLPLTTFGESSGLSGIVNRVIKHKAGLYTSTSTGVYLLHNDKINPLRSVFSKVEGLEIDYAWSFLEFDAKLLAATSGGVYEIDGLSARKIAPGTFDVRSLYRSSDKPDLLMAGTIDGLLVFRYNNNGWQLEGSMEGVRAEIRNIYQEDSLLWLGTFHRGIYRVILSNRSIIEPEQINLYDTLHGLPSMIENSVVPFRQGKIFHTNRGIYRFNKREQEFQPDPILGEIFANGSRAIYCFEEAPSGRVWMHLKNRALDIRETGYAVPQSQGSYLWETETFAGFDDTKIYSFYTDQKGITWLGSIDKLIRFDPSTEVKLDRDFKTLIRKVAIRGDSMMYGGSSGHNDVSEPMIFDYSNNSLRFSYSATSYDQPEETFYQYQLVGFDEDWSPWTPESRKDYTNLPEGNYEFRVRGKNVYQIQGGADAYQFTILPPWYRTWWSYLFYALMAAAIIQLVVAWRSRKLKMEKAALEAIVAQRTREINEKNTLLRDQAEKLKDLDKIKSNFFANISHEFRTPLTLIKGMISAKRSGDFDELSNKHMEVMSANADRLLRLVNQLLDLSRLESGNLKLQVSQKDIISFVKGLSLSFETLAIEKNIQLDIESNEKELLVYFDRDKMEKVIYNLLSNAFKFTREQGKITVTVQKTNETVNISIKDNGVGMEKGQLARIFDRFYQVDSSGKHTHEGSGIGLALARELVELHHGTIEVESEPGHGTTFRLCLPLDGTHFNAREIVDQPVEESWSPDHEADLDKYTDDLYAEVLPDQEDRPVVLIVEDNKDVRNFIREQLMAHYAIEEAENGVAGLNKAEELVPDLIVSDVMMPAMDGFELTRQLRDKVTTSHIPVILLTARADGEDKIEGLVTGADDYITKPFDGRELIARIDNLIRSRQQLKERFTREIMLEPASIAVPSSEEKFITRLMQIIEEHLSDSQLSVEKLSDFMSISRIHLHRKMKALTGQSTSQFIRSMRLKRARQLLDQKSATVTEIAYQVGFNNISYFAKCFKDQFGVLPSELETES